MIHPSISVRTMPINHGHNTSGVYKSAAFFIRHDTLNREFIFFGDVEPDKLAQKPHNIDIWRAAALKIPHTLSAIFIECSWPSGRPDECLFGHLNPEHLVEELTVLATEVTMFRKSTSTSSRTTRARPARKKQKLNPIVQGDLAGVLDGLVIYIMHCKDNFDQKQPMRQVIVSQVKALVEARCLGAQVIAVEPGMRISRFFPSRKSPC
jgi:cAMP phosphodiesterase